MELNILRGMSPKRTVRTIKWNVISIDDIDLHKLILLFQCLNRKT